MTKASKDDGATFHWEADWDYWKYMPTLTAVEGVALMSGVKPELVDPGDLFYSSLLVEHQRLEIAKRRFPAKQYPDGVPKALFLEWIAEMEETSPALSKNLHPKFRECFLKNPPLAAAATTTPKNTASEAIPGDVRQPTTEGHLEEPASAAPKFTAKDKITRKGKRKKTR